jgi:hypothetical protein
MLAHWQQTVAWDTPLIPFSHSKFRTTFQQVVSYCGLQELNLKPYSLRRGGATDMWMSTNSYNIVQHTGRWTSERAMKQYIDDSTALLSNMKVTPSALQRALIAHYQSVSHVKPPVTWKSRGREIKRTSK